MRNSEKQNKRRPFALSSRKNFKQLLGEVFCDIRNNEGRGKCYQPIRRLRLIDVQVAYNLKCNGIVGGFEFTVLQRNLKEWHKSPWNVCLRVLKEATKVGSTATLSGTVY